MLHNPWYDMIIKLYTEKCLEVVEDISLVQDNNTQEEDTFQDRNNNFDQSHCDSDYLNHITLQLFTRLEYKIQF